MNFLRAAEHYVVLGFHVFPLKPGSKEPATKHGVHDATDDADLLSDYARWYPNANIGVGCGPDSCITVVDVDKHHGGIEILNALIKQHGDMPKCPMAQTPQGGFHLYFDYTPRLGNSNGRLGQGIDVKTQGGYVVLPPSYWDGTKKGQKVAAGGSYKWVRPPLGSDMPRMPHWMLKLLLPDPTPQSAPKNWDRNNADLVHVAEALKFVSNHDYETWTKVGMALKVDFGDAGFDLWNSWSSHGYAGHDSNECQRKWASFKRTTGVAVGSILHEARMGGADLKKIFGHVSQGGAE
jgi:hypothetical protein